MIVRIFPLRKPNSNGNVKINYDFALGNLNPHGYGKKEKKGKTLLQVKIILFAFCFRLYIIKILYLLTKFW